MGKENSKGKEKKLARQAEIAAEKARKAIVAEAVAVKEPLAGFAAFTRFARNGLDAQICCTPADQVTSADHEWAFNLLKTNMEAIHSAGGFNWNDSNQRAMLREEGASILMARDSTDDAPRELGCTPLPYLSARI